MITRLLIIANVLCYFWEYRTGALSSDPTVSTPALIKDGVLIPLLVTHNHEWWRIIASGFLHANIPHIAINMLSLYWLGRFIEVALRPVRMLVVYAIALVGSGIAVVYLSPPDAATLGASGAIFGLFGALFAIGLKLGDRGRDLVRGNIGILVLNLVWSFSFRGISWQGHIGGLITGFAVTLLIFWPPRPIMTRVYDPASGAEYHSQIEPPAR